MLQMKYAKTTTKISAKTLFSAVVFCCMLSIPAFSQTPDQEEDVVPATQPATTNPTPGLNTNGPWGNATSTSGSATSRTEDGQTEIASGAAGTTSTNGNGPRAGALRTGGNVEADGRTPGGNPDVPFDPMMNVAFLVLGIAFSAFIWFKKAKLQPVAAKK